MENITQKKIIGNLSTITSYARKVGVTRPTIYRMIRERKLTTVLIDGITFIKTS